MLIRDRDRPLDEGEWRAFVTANAFGHLVAGGWGRPVPVVVPTQFVLRDDDIVLHLARPNPIWAALEENPRVLLSVAGDWAYVPSSWKAIGDEDPALGIPTTYYAAVQIVGDAAVLDDPAEVTEVLRIQLGDLQPDIDAADPSEHAVQLRAIRALRIPIDDVRAKFKYGGNVDEAHRRAVHDRLLERCGPGDVAAARHVERRLGGDGA